MHRVRSPSRSCFRRRPQTYLFAILHEFRFTEIHQAQLTAVPIEQAPVQSSHYLPLEIAKLTTLVLSPVTVTDFSQLFGSEKTGRSTLCCVKTS